MSNLKQYQNGNYIVTLDLSDGTKIRRTEDDDFQSAFAECCDVKITDRCDGGCPYCYEGCTKAGKHGKLDYIFLDNLHPYTELAINGNDLSHPDLIPFLKRMKIQRIIVNMTVSQKHFERNVDLLKNLTDNKLIHGLGISLQDPNESFLKTVAFQFPNAIIHVINGLWTREQVIQMTKKHLKVLVLGYKDMRRGHEFLEENEEMIQKNQKWLKINLPSLIQTEAFQVISFDNLALQQLDVHKLFKKDEEWNSFYMGNDGDYTFYIDLVEGTFGRNSLATERYPITDSIDDMFQKIRKEKE